MAFLVRKGARNPPGRSNAQSAMLTIRHGIHGKQLFNSVLYSYSYRIVFGIEGGWVGVRIGN